MVTDHYSARTGHRELGVCNEAFRPCKSMSVSIVQPYPTELLLTTAGLV